VHKGIGNLVQLSSDFGSHIAYIPLNFTSFTIRFLSVSLLLRFIDCIVTSSTTIRMVCLKNQKELFPLIKAFSTVSFGRSAVTSMKRMNNPKIVVIRIEQANEGSNGRFCPGPTLFSPHRPVKSQTRSQWLSPNPPKPSWLRMRSNLIKPSVSIR
jgi:hypothetical protein